VRTPARLENDLHRIYVVLPPEQENDLPVALGFQGNKNVNAVKTDSYETGLRRQFSENLYVDFGGFFTHSDEALGLTATEPGISEYGGTPYVDALAQLDNTYTTEYHGGELVIDYRPFEQLRLVGSYAYLDGVSFSNDSSLDVCDGDPEHLPKTCAVGKVIPNNVFSLQSNWNPYDGLTIDTFVKFIDSFQTGALNEDGEFVDVNSYVNLDVRVAYKLTDSIELAVVGQNLAENKHVEWVDYPNSSAPINLERGVYGEIIFSLK
jgi:iron complex outermembrane receptor protein